MAAPLWDVGTAKDLGAVRLFLSSLNPDDVAAADSWYSLEASSDVDISGLLAIDRVGCSSLIEDVTGDGVEDASRVERLCSVSSIQAPAGSLFGQSLGSLGDIDGTGCDETAIGSVLMTWAAPIVAR